MTKEKQAPKKIAKKENKDWREVFRIDLARICGISANCKPHLQTVKNDYSAVLEGSRNVKGKIVEMDVKDFVDSKLYKKFNPEITEGKRIFHHITLKFKDPNYKWAVPVLDTLKEKAVDESFCAQGAEMLGYTKIPVLVCALSIENVDKYLKNKKINYKEI